MNKEISKNKILQEEKSKKEIAHDLAKEFLKTQPIKSKELYINSYVEVYQFFLNELKENEEWIF